MKNQFVPYDIALALKKLGFDEPCFTYWVNDGVNITFATTHNRSGWSMIGFENNQMIKKAGLCTAPLYQEAFDWFREKHNIHAYILRDEMRSNLYRFIIQHGGEELYGEWRDSNNQANLDCLNQLIELIQS